MSKRAAPAHHDRRDDDSRSALARLIDTPHLAQVVRQLTPDVLHQVIRHHGLEACGALVAAATPQQVTAILDLDLWRPTAAGGTERFDAARFGDWLEALIEEGEAVAARVIAEMDEGLATTGLSRYVRVFDPGIFEPAFSSDDDREWTDLKSADDIEVEIGGYVIRARTRDTWDALVSLLVALNDNHPRAFHALMRGCRDLSHSTPEEDGLDSLLQAPEQALHDAAVDREQRRTQQGYVSAADARAFLQAARQPARRGASAAVSPIAAAYFRDLNEAIASTSASDGGSAVDHPEISIADADVAAALEAAVEVMAEAGVATAQPRALLGPAAAGAAGAMHIEQLMAHVFTSHPAAYLARNQELTFLANALLAGCSVYTRPFTIREAWDAAVGVCNVGLDRGPVPAAFLADHDLIAEFEIGWRLLHQHVTRFVADRLIAALSGVPVADAEVQRDLGRLRRELKQQRAAGTPWRVAESLEVIAILDTPVWACLCGLLSECPVFPDALTAMLDHRASAVSASAYACFTTRAQLDRVRDFGDRLRDLLLY